MSEWPHCLQQKVSASDIPVDPVPAGVPGVAGVDLGAVAAGGVVLGAALGVALAEAGEAGATKRGELSLSLYSG